jgi:sec-independent protein translocase protein TatB
MFDVGWSEMAVIALVALVVIGPKDLPKAMRTAAFWVRKARGLAAEFHSGLNEMVREAELEEAREAIRSAKNLNIERTIENTVDPTGTVSEAFQTPKELALPPDTPLGVAAAPEPPTVVPEQIEPPAAEPELKQVGATSAGTA